MRTLLTRREWMGAAAAVPLAAATGHPFGHTLGAQLYSVRSVLPKATESTIQAIADIGYREVEVDRASLERLAPILKDHGLKPVSVHFETPLVTGNWEPWEKNWRDTPHAPRTMSFAEAAEGARKFGVEYMTMAYILPAEREGLDFKQLADKMNRAGEQARAAGMKFCYHNHAFEFKGEEGQRPIDLLLAGWDKKDVGLEMDVFWVSVAGQDPVEMLKRLKGRVPLLHLKDKAKGTAVQYSEGVTHETFKEVGNGSLDFAAILRAAAAAGVQHYFVEQDYTPADPVASLKQSYQFLRSVKVS